MDQRLRYGLIGAAGLAAAVAALPFLVPAGICKAPLEDGVSRATGRAFRVNGALRVTLFPTFGLRAENVTLANMQGGRAPTLASAEDIRFGVRLLPLLVGRIEMTDIVLDRPDIHLEVDAQGHANWTLARGASAARPSGAAPRSVSFATHFSSVRIARGRISYANARSGNTRAFDDIDADVALTELDRPASIEGSFAQAGQRIRFAAKIATPRLLLQDRQTALDLSLTSALLRADFEGTVTPDGTVLGHLGIDTPSVRRAGAWLGARLPAGGGLGPLSLETRIRGDNRVAALTGLTLKLDGAAMRGDVALDTRGAIPAVMGALSIDHLDVNPYVETPRKPGAAGPPRPPHSDESWSGDPIVLDVLRKFDADLTLDADSIAVKRLRLGKSHVALTLNGGHLVARLDPVALYGGTGHASLDVNASTAAPTFRNALEFDNVALQPFLADTVGVRQIEGIGTLKLDIAARGASADAVMHGLNGSGSIAFRDGRLRGVDLGGVARGIATVLGGSAGPEALTTYTRMDGGFQLVNGVLGNKDFRLAGPLLSMTGEGAVDIGNRAIDFRVVPQASADLGNHNRVTIGVPFRIKGPWRHVHYTADVAGLVHGVLGNLATGKAPFKGLFGTSSKPADPNAPPKASKKKHKNIGDALKNMFGIH